MSDLRAKLTLTLDDQLSRAAKAALGSLKVGSEAAVRGVHGLGVELDKLGGDSGRLVKNDVVLARIGTEASKTSPKLRTLGDVFDTLNRKIAAGYKHSGGLTKQFGALNVAAGNLIAGATSSAIRGMGGALVESATSAIKFESEMANVAKVVDGLKTPAGAITAEYSAMEKKVLELSTTIAGPGAAGFAQIYAAAGEAGIAKQDLDRFAESAAKVSVAFGVSAEEAGDGMAKLRSGLSLSQTEVESLAGTMNYLSDGMAVNARQAMQVALTSGGIGRTANVSAQEVVGLGAAMISAGAQADVAATASKNYILAMSAGDTATLRQRKAFKSLGMDAEDVARKFTGTAQQRLAIQQQVLSKLGALSNDKRISTLSSLFGQESLGAIAGITSDVGKFTSAMQMATDQTAAASSISKEYSIRSKTTENAVALLKANVEGLGIKFGQALLPHINKVVEFLTSPEGKEWGAHAVEKAVGVVTSLASGISFVVKAVSGLTDAFGGTAVAIAAVGAASIGLTGPFGAALLAGTAAGYGIAAGFKAAADAILGTTNLIDAASKMRVDATGKKLSEIAEAGKAEDETTRAREARAYQARKAGAALEAAVVAKAGVKSFGELDESTRTSIATRQSKLMVSAQEGRGFDEELASVEGQTAAVAKQRRPRGRRQTNADMYAMTQELQSGMGQMQFSPELQALLAKSKAGDNVTVTVKDERTIVKRGGAEVPFGQRVPT